LYDEEFEGAASSVAGSSGVIRTERSLELPCDATGLPDASTSAGKRPASEAFAMPRPLPSLRPRPASVSRHPCQREYLDAHGFEPSIDDVPWYTQKLPPGRTSSYKPPQPFEEALRRGPGNKAALKAVVADTTRLAALIDHTPGSSACVAWCGGNRADALFMLLRLFVHKQCDGLDADAANAEVGDLLRETLQLCIPSSREAQHSDVMDGAFMLASQRRN